jgi:glycosyltransferase involved in cell wall biosynthesis
VRELPKISIVTPSLNQGRTIEDTILSVLAQDYPSVEHIVVDGGSTDETLSVLRKYPHLRWVSEPDRGQTHAINKGIGMSSGEIFAYLNTDDLYRPGAFHAVSDVFQRSPDVDVIVGDAEAIDDNLESPEPCPARLDRVADLLRFWEWGNGFCVPQPAVFVRRRALDRAGLFDESYNLAMDYEMWLRLAARSKFQVLPRTLAAFRLGEETKTSRYRCGMVLEAFRASRKHAGAIAPKARWSLVLCSRREAGGHLLTLAEEGLKHERLDRPPLRILLRAVGFWPPLFGSPRVWRDLGRALLQS